MQLSIFTVYLFTYLLRGKEGTRDGGKEGGRNGEMYSEEYTLSLHRGLHGMKERRGTGDRDGGKGKEEWKGRWDRGKKKEVKGGAHTSFIDA